MSTALAQYAPESKPVATARNLGAHLSADSMSGGTAKRGGGPATMLLSEPQQSMAMASIPAQALSSLDALPWLTQSGHATGTVREDAGRNGPGPGRFLLQAGIGAALAVLCGGAWFVSGGTMAQPASMTMQTNVARGQISVAPSAPASPQVSSATAVSGQTPAQTTLPTETLRAPISGQTNSKALANAQTNPRSAATRMKPPAPLPNAASLAVGQVATIEAAAVIDEPVQPGGDLAATPATISQYRATVEECRDAIRAVIRLGDRQRPGRNASLEEQTAYRLRQQNAEAAKDYRSYLDTLARPMRRAKSEVVARQSLERARQTLGYVNTMLAASQASLR